jgi:hypothetical protein
MEGGCVGSFIRPPYRILPPEFNALLKGVWIRRRRLPSLYVPHIAFYIDAESDKACNACRSEIFGPKASILLAPARRRNPLQTSATNLKPPLKETMKMRLIVALTAEA